jgi:hypothetical protein
MNPVTLLVNQDVSSIADSIDKYFEETMITWNNIELDLTSSSIIFRSLIIIYHLSYLERRHYQSRDLNSNHWGGNILND